MQPLFQWKSNKCYIYWACIFSLRYPACNVHVLYCYLWFVQLYSIFHIISQMVWFFLKKSYWT